MIAGVPGQPAHLHRSSPSLFSVGRPPDIELGHGVDAADALRHHVGTVYTPEVVTPTLAAMLPDELSDARLAAERLLEIVRIEAYSVRSRVVPYNLAPTYHTSDNRLLRRGLRAMQSQDAGKTLRAAVGERRSDLQYAVKHGQKHPEIALLARFALLAKSGEVRMTRKNSSGRRVAVPTYPERLSLYGLACHGQLLKKHNGV